MAEEIITIPLPQGFTKSQVFEMLADFRGYKAKIQTRDSKTKTLNSEQATIDFIATMNGVTMAFHSTLTQDDGTFIVRYISLGEIDNQESKIDFGKKQFGDFCKDLFNQVNSHNAKKELLEQAEQASKAALEAVSFEGLEII